MNAVSQPEIIGLDVSCDWLDLHCVSDSRQIRLPNTDEGHSELEAFGCEVHNRIERKHGIIGVQFAASASAHDDPSIKRA